MAFSKTTVRALTDLGLNNLESLVYLSLLKHPGSTGYRTAKNLGKAVSNVYQALESLTRQGFVILQYEGKDRLYSPVPVTEVVARLKSDVERKTKILEKELKNLETPALETGIYKIDNGEQLFNKVETLMDNARGSILLTADAFFLRRFKNRLEKAGADGRKILILGYERIEFSNCEFLLLDTRGKSPWPGHWIIMDVDGVQHLIAFFEKPDTLTHAIWCDDQYVSFWIHFFMLADFTLMTFFEETRNDPDNKKIHDRIHDLYSRYSPGKLQLAKYYTSFTWMKRQTEEKKAEADPCE